MSVSAERAQPIGSGAWLVWAIALAAGTVVATAVAFDVPLYLALVIGGVIYTSFTLRYPYGALLIYVFAFPVLDPYVRLDLGGGVPNVTFERVAVTLVAMTLGMQAMLRTRRLVPPGAVERSMLILCGIISFDIYMRSGSMAQDGLVFYDEFVTPFLLYIILKNLVAGGTDIRKSLIALALTALYLAPHGLYQFITHAELPFWIAPDDTVHSLVEEEGRARGPFNDSVSYGALSSVVFISAIFLLAWSTTLGKRCLYAALMLGAGACVVVCLTRAVWLGLLIAILFAAYAERKLRALVAALLICATLGGVGAYLWPGEEPSAVSKRAGDLATVYIRLGLYNAAIRMAAERPLLGYGNEAYTIFQRNRAKYVTSIGNIEAEFGNMAGPPHNTYLTMLLKYGVFGMAAYTAVLVLIVSVFLRLRHSRPHLPWPIAGYATMMLSQAIIYLSVSMTTDVMAFKFFTNLFFILSGGAAGLLIRYPPTGGATLPQ